MKFCQKTQESPVKPEPAEEEETAPEVSAWDRFDAAERQRRIVEFVAAEKSAFEAAWMEIPSIIHREIRCKRCGQRNDRHHVTTVKPDRLEYEVGVREEDGEMVLSKSLYRVTSLWGWGWSDRRFPECVFTVHIPMLLNVTCECGNVVGSYRPLKNLEKYEEHA